MFFYWISVTAETTDYYSDEVADLCAFLASPLAGYITGTIVTIDGGISARGSVI